MKDPRDRFKQKMWRAGLDPEGNHRHWACATPGVCTCGEGCSVLSQWVLWTSSVKWAVEITDRKKKNVLN